MTIYDTKTLGKLIRDRRKYLGYTQETVSNYTNLSKSFISDVENGKKSAEIEKIIYLINSLGMDINVEPRGSK